MIIKEIKEKPGEHFILFIILFVGAILFFQFRYNELLRHRVIYGVVSSYFFWSLFHHYKKGDLHLSIIIEYFLFALLAVILIAF
ncbi:MAG: hypothetical protein Q8P53_02180 [Candidatus Shapirobacteria bacterium]|nr:hypothetical protein [Candidatus Shapirobacteria bacterium]